MKILYQILENFASNEKINIIILIILSLTLTAFQTNGISFVTANIIEAIEHGNAKLSYTFYKYFIGISLVYVVLYYAYKLMQNTIIVKMTQYIRYRLFETILLSNNENMSSVNFTKFVTPVNRTTSSCGVLFYDILSTIIPSIAFLIMISVYFMYKNTFLGLFFIISNMLIGLYIAYFWDSLLEQKNEYEVFYSTIEKYMIDIFNNMDKVIYRGQVNEEINDFSNQCESMNSKAIDVLYIVANHIMVLTIFVYLIMFVCIGWLIKTVINKEISPTIFITFFTILLMYRDRILDVISNTSDFLDFTGRMLHMSTALDNMISTDGEVPANIMNILNTKYETVILPFKTIRFENVNYSYKKDAAPIFENKNLTIHTDKNIIGITGLSGKGKSTFAKLILKMYKCTSGAIYIDEHDIAKIDANYIRQNITYVNQSSKLFDKKVVENIMYGCNDDDACKAHLAEIMQHPKIRELYKNIDIHTTESGLLGENLSGGQRQVANIISGLINPCKILILDEPTNALDPALKTEILDIIYKFKIHKQCIMIITHDQDVHTLFDETIHM